MNIIIIAAVLNLVSGNLVWHPDFPASGRNADGTIVLDLSNKPKAIREACGWYALEDNPPSVPEGQRAVPNGYERTEEGYRQLYRVETIPVEPRRIYKYDLSVAAMEYGEITNLVTFVSADVGVKWMWDAAEILVDNDPYFITATNEVVQSGLISNAKVKAILDRAYGLGQVTSTK